jgi:hypothetical protein
MENYKARKFIYELDRKLLESCGEALNTDKRFTQNEVMEHMREIISNASKYSG